MANSVPVMIWDDDLEIIDALIQRTFSDIDFSNRKNRRNLILQRKSILHTLVQEIPTVKSAADEVVCSQCGDKVVRIHPDDNTILLSSSNYIGIDTCYSCMNEYCSSTECESCSLGHKRKDEECEFSYLKYTEEDD